MSDSVSFFEDDELENISEKISALDELFLNSINYQKSNKYFELLTFINRFPSLSPFNAFLVHMQNSGVQIVNTPAKWKKYGRAVKYQARPLVILVPFGPVQFVYDIADTEGDPLPDEIINPFSTIGYLAKSQYDTTVTNCEKEGIVVQQYDMKKASAGYACILNNKFTIVINSTYSLNEKYSTLIHELGHIFCGHSGSYKNSWWKARITSDNTIKEIEAETVSYLVCKRFGLKTTSEQYLSNYLSTDFTLPPLSLNTILNVSGYIEQMSSRQFKSRMKKIK